MNESKEKRVAPAGTWSSPVSAESLARAGIRLAQPCIDGDVTYWLEGRPTEQGRSVLVACDQQGETRDLTPTPYDVRSRVHEYGGSAYLVSRGQIFFINAKDQGIYQIQQDNINCVYQQDQHRFTNMQLDQARNRLLAVCERHTDAHEPENFLASINLETGLLTCVHDGADFYSSPVLSNNGQQLAFLTWNHPHMPWDETNLHLASIDDHHVLSQLTTVCSGSASFSPQFGPDDRLYFVNDQNNWWNLYVRTKNAEIKQLSNLTGELGMPHWIFGMSTYGFVNEHLIAGAYTRNGEWKLCTIDSRSGEHHDATPWDFSAIEHLSASQDGIVCHAASPSLVDSIVRVALEPHVTTKTLKCASDVTLHPNTLSHAMPIRFGEVDSTAYGFFYAPVNEEFKLPPEQKPPLIVLAHGGPTTATHNGLNPRIQFWTSRGFAVLDVNYRGSTGFGRTFRHSLHGQWGAYDVEDCVNGAQYLIDQNWVHSEHIYIMGSSAGGYTVLSALTFTDFFAGGISLYGIGDLSLLVQDTHKFESRYTDALIAPFDESLYQQRSPLFSADQISVPVLFFQGTEDKVVPPNQAITMVEALKNKGVPVGYVTMEGEGHGFRRSDSIITLMQLSLEFFCTISGVENPNQTPLHLYNSDQLNSA